MSKQLTEILLRLDALAVAVEKNSTELRKFRLKLFGKKRKVPTTASITFPDWCYEYEQMTINLDSKQWKDVQLGKVITVRGQGKDVSEYVDDGQPTTEWDYWTFNKESAGHVQVVMGEETANWQADIAYDGHLDACEIVETEVTPKQRAKAS